MDSSYDPTFVGNGFDNGEEDFSMSSGGFNVGNASSHAFDKVPLPVLISDILNHQGGDDKIQVGVYSFGLVRFCGLVVGKEVKEKEVHLMVCDPEETDTENCQKLAVVLYNSVVDPQPNDLINALGKFRKHGTSVSAVTFAVTILEDRQMAQIYKLEAQLARVYYSQNIPERISEGEIPEFENTMFSTIPYQAPTQGNAAGAPSQSAPGIPGQLLAIIGEATTGDQPTGINIEAIIARIGKQNCHTIDADLNHLVNEGLIYRTVDDNHYATV